MNQQKTITEIELILYANPHSHNVELIQQCINELEMSNSPRAATLVLYAKARIQYAQSNSKLSSELYKQCIDRFVIDNDKSGTAHSYTGLGLCYIAMEMYPQALESLNGALTLFTELDDKENLPIIFSNLSRMYFLTENYALAVDYSEQAAAKYEERNDKLGLARAITNIGIVNYYSGDYPGAFEYYDRALNLFTEIDSKYGIASVNMNIGGVHVTTGNYPLAIEYFERALAMHEELGDKIEVARTIGNMGAAYTETGNLSLGLEYITRSLLTYEELGEMAEIAGLTSNIAEIYRRLHHYDLALSNAQKSLELSNKLGLNQKSLDALCTITEIYLTMGDLVQAEQTISALDNIMALQPRSAIAAVHARCGVKISQGNLTGVADMLTSALELARNHGLKFQEAEIHNLLRDLAQKQNDLAGYIEHNNEYLRITEEINGKETATKLAMQTKEREIRAEREERDRERAVLYSTLPKAVADRIVKGEKVTGDEYHNAAVLFADIVGFTIHSSKLSATHVTRLLAEIYSELDKISEQYKVTKVKTIGDSYMCFKGDGEAIENANGIAGVALAIARSTFTWPLPDGFEYQEPRSVKFRIGVAMGHVTAGVIGTDRLQYDIWSDTVNLASRMESTGEGGRIQVNETFAQALASHTPSSVPHTLVPRGTVDVKGMGAVQTWWLQGGEVTDQ